MSTRQATPAELPYSEYRDRILAGWQGKSLGGVIGAPLENQKHWLPMTEDNLWPDKLAPNDDLDIQLVWLEAMQERGVYLTHDDLAEFWQDRCAYNFCEYGFFLHNVQRGIHPPLSGTWNNSFFYESEGCPIRAEIWGYVAPGNPELAAELATFDAELDHGGASVEIERFLAACNAQAFISQKLDDVLAAGLRVVPADSRAAYAVDDVRRICTKYPEPFDAWRLIIREYGDRDASKAITNHALVLMSLFLGQMDFRKTMLICARAGWDTDCTAATAGALLGAMNGCASLPADWLSRLGETLVCGIQVKHSGVTLVQLAEDTARVGVEMAAARNRQVTLTDTPDVAVRPAPAPDVRMDAQYPQEPVLWNEKPTPVTLTVSNPGTESISGALALDVPDGIEVTGADKALTVPAAGAASVNLTIRRRQGGEWLADKNLLPTRFVSDGKVAAERRWGLGGARQWLVYGPYWDMWDRDRYSICPFHNDQVKCTPGQAGIQGDTYNAYAHIAHPYLDEARLLREDIAEELPFRVECGEELMTEAHLGGYMGQGCYYLVRTFRYLGEPRGAALRVGTIGPYRMWVDGKQIAHEDRVRGWAVQDHAYGGGGVHLTGETQRLVVKVARVTDDFKFSVIFLGAGDPERKRGISFMFDELEDLPSGYGVGE